MYPPKVHKKGQYLYYVTTIKGRRKWTKLCPADAPEHQLHGRLWALLQTGGNTLARVMEDYAKIKLARLAPSTQKEYQGVIERRLMKHFGHMHPDDLTPQDIAAYLEMREQQGHGACGNREMAVLSSIYNHGMRIRACLINPCRGVKRNKEEPRTYYIDDAGLRCALRNSNPGLRHLIWAAYLTGFRQGDLRRLTKDNITPDGIRLIQSKDGKHEVRLWTESLRKVVRRALERSRCDRVFTNERGQPFTKEAVTSAMGRLKKATGIEWRFHDLRAKAESDHKTGLGLMRRYARGRKLEAVR